MQKVCILDSDKSQLRRQFELKRTFAIAQIQYHHKVGSLDCQESPHILSVGKVTP